MLPQLPGVSASGVELVRFDRRVSVVKPEDMRRLQTPDGYSCTSGRAVCDSQESHVDQALARVAAAKGDALSVVVSDLWLTNSEVLTTGGVALSRPLTDILSSGRGIAVYGFESPYAGRVYDLPSGTQGASAARRYLFVLAIGAPTRLDAFHAAMLRAPSASIARDLQSGAARYSLFTTEPVGRAASGSQTFEPTGPGPLTKAAFLPVRQGVRIPQFKLDRAQAMRLSEGTGSVAWKGVSETMMRPGAVWQGPSLGTTSIYRMVGSKCLPAAGDWRAEGRSGDGWSGGSYSLTPTTLAALPRGSYLLVGKLRRTGLQSPNDATKWMRDWSFDAAGERAALARRTVPTLNLAETARLMENALAQAAERRPADIGGFAAAVQID
ncbi:hypothetical protein [Sphingomonas sp.]|uniref:hypothetical protein n=1 Tax=Sphingomonas sp. TaxID=28214 RepID=UPI000DBBE62F|nr:hypothetical protein [Sphingomonas sp.]PZT93986.1 MAG: hypothetical protein DI625_07480 [Sphingomonas sp.]